MQENLNQGDGSLEEYTKLLIILSQQMKELEALNSSISQVTEGELASRFLLIIENLKVFMATSAAAQNTMVVILAKLRNLQGNGL
ncbi:hypothetical protein [Coleofasciculus sp. FACHB-SPT9]|uniref:hypothetical protein n=1 Tax=Cyanophyceae TaxID=3028117 RepID=UPI001686D4C4|nr:hypothetical protein [Coleofasciculus sp. FACHB-SPT9]MBD1889492.1 hypothetical protein [Coleofasciculus sp. FACHB-SPT9]